MKKLFKKFVLGICFFVFSFGSYANDTIRFTWQGSTSNKSIYITATYDKQFTVNWQDGYIDTIIGIGNYQTLSHTYTDSNNYSVVIIGITADCVFTALSCPYAQITFLDVRGSAALQKLICNNNELTHLDISTNTALEYLECQANQLTSLILNKSTALEFLRCNNNYLTNLDLQSYTELKNLWCNDNKITNLDLQTNTKLLFLYCYKNLLTALNISKNTNLIEVICNNNLLTNLDLTANTDLNYIDCSDNKLTDLDMSADTALWYFYCSGNKLKKLNLQTNKRLNDLNCSNNLLTDLDLSANIKLYKLDCSTNLLSNLDLQANTALWSLTCSNNALSYLDIQTNTVLQHLYCPNNLLTYLNLHANTALKFLDCSGNQLTELNLTGMELLSIKCYNNHLQLSDLYEASEMISSPYSKILGTQHLGTQIIMLNDTIDFSTQIEFGDTATVFTILNKSGMPTSTSDYTLKDGIIAFNYTDRYKIIMTNSAITSHPSSPAEVIAEYWVVSLGSLLSDLSVSEGILTPDFDSFIIDYFVDVGYNVSSIIITATPMDVNAIIVGDTGLQQLQLGTNEFIIIVMDKDGISTLNYTIIVNRLNVDIVGANSIHPIQIYPNPTTGELRVKSDELRVESVELFDIVGKLQTLENRISDIGQSEITINISHLSAGLYFLKIDGKTYKIIKE